jgi:hypothetical protein
MLTLYLFNGVLLTRLFLLFRDEVVDRKYVGLTWAFQMLLLLPLAPWQGVGLLALVLSIVNGIWYWAERHFSPKLHLVRLATLIALFAVVAAALAPIVGLSFKESVTGLGIAAEQYLPFANTFSALNWRSVWTYIFGVLLCVSEANIFVRVVIENFNLRPTDSGLNTGSNSPQASVEYKRGRVIGLLERLILFYLVLDDQFGALGFVIAAKTMARFKNLEDRNFAEYFLVGTFLSVAAAGCVALFTKWLLT